MDINVLNNIEKFVDENRQNILHDISRLVKINSVIGEPEQNAPFGRGPADALNLGLEISKELGLEVYNCEDKIGYASVGKGEKYISTITHLDVVPTGDGWSEDPFIMREKDGYIIGRGVLDDKGPSVICLYALKYLKDNNVKLNYEVRALLGINEETEMADVEYYLSAYPAPAFCFSPDANFPLCNGEKGIYHGKIISNVKSGNVADFKGGFAPNAVCDKAEVWVKADALKKNEKIQIEKQGDLWHLTAFGVGGHASMPEGTVSAIGILVDYILENDIANDEERPFFELLALLHHDYTGKLLGVDAVDGKFEPLTIVGGVIGKENDRIWQSIDSRYPTNTDAEKIRSTIKSKAGECAEVVTESDIVPFYMSTDNPAVKVCMDAYNFVTGEDAEPYTIGGGTYARHFPNAVSFGPEHPERLQPEWAGPIHGIDEAANVEYLFEALKIYIAALIELQNIEF